MTDMNTHRHKAAPDFTHIHVQHAHTHRLTHSYFPSLPAIHPLNFYLLVHYMSEKSHSKPYKVFHTLKLLFNFWIPLVIRPHFFFFSNSSRTPSSYKLKPAASHYWKITLSEPAKQFSVKFYYCGGMVKSSQQLMHPNMDGTAPKRNVQDEAQMRFCAKFEKAGDRKLSSNGNWPGWSEVTQLQTEGCTGRGAKDDLSK